MKKLALIAGAAIAALVIGTGGAVAGSMVTSANITDGTIRVKDLRPGLQNKVNTDAFKGAYYATAKYDVGDTNQGAIATVACSAQTDVAVAGGVQALGLGGHPAAVASSFPGRMDWSTNTPFADRLDGWIVQFDATTAPEKATLYALCVPASTVSVVNTYTQSS